MEKTWNAVCNLESWVSLVKRDFLSALRHHKKGIASCSSFNLCWKSSEGCSCSCSRLTTTDNELYKTESYNIPFKTRLASHCRRSCCNSPVLPFFFACLPAWTPPLQLLFVAFLYRCQVGCWVLLCFCYATRSCWEASVVSLIERRMLCVYLLVIWFSIDLYCNALFL